MKDYVTSINSKYMMVCRTFGWHYIIVIAAVLPWLTSSDGPKASHPQAWSPDKKSNQTFVGQPINVLAHDTEISLQLNTLYLLSQKINLTLGLWFPPSWTGSQLKRPDPLEPLSLELNGQLVNAVKCAISTPRIIRYNFEVKTNISNWLKKKIMLGLRSDQFDQSC